MKSLNNYISEKLIINKNYEDYYIEPLEKFWDDNHYNDCISKENIKTIWNGLYGFIIDNLKIACNEVSSGITHRDELDNAFSKRIKKEILSIKLKNHYVDCLGLSIYNMGKEFTDIENTFDDFPEEYILDITSFGITVNYININIEVILCYSYIVIKAYDLACKCRMGFIIIKIDRA